MERRHVDQQQAPPGAATEVAVAESVEAEGLPPAISQAQESTAHHEARRGASLLALSVGAAGVVFGDIGTSPLYVMQAAFGTEHGLARTPGDVLGFLSLVTWSLLLVVTAKYVSFIMRADNRGEGGILALLSLLIPDLEELPRGQRRMWIIGGLSGAALLYADGTITPAISVLSAIEGLEVASPALRPAVLPLTVMILLGLFAVQRKGTSRIGRVFGPVMVVWFIALGMLGARQLAASPEVLRALSPTFAASFFASHGVAGFLVLGAVILAVSGAEALYADMGHFGKRPIRLVWLVLVLPCLLLNYFGQGALLLRAPRTVSPFFEMAPRALLYPFVALAAATTVIASQAMISGAFSITRQLMHLGYSPLVTVTHTSPDQRGQVYIPQVNLLLLAGCLVLVFAFRTSENLAAAYGLAVSGTMVLTTALFAGVARLHWRWPLVRIVPLAVVFLAIDLAFFGANLAKIPSGGWVPLLIAGLGYFTLVTWRAGRHSLVDARRATSLAIRELVANIRSERPCRTPGTGIFLTPAHGCAPAILRQHLERIHALHEQVVLLTVRSTGIARVPPGERITAEPFPLGITQITARYGYMQSVSLSDVIGECRRCGVEMNADTTTFYVTREHLRPTGPAQLARWRKKMFIFLQRNAPSMQDFLDLPPGRVVELGTTIEV
jgi:KUP system potassium uptake protein